jgi:hypothetical protein
VLTRFKETKDKESVAKTQTIATNTIDLIFIISRFVRIYLLIGSIEPLAPPFFSSIAGITSSSSLHAENVSEDETANKKM